MERFVIAANTDRLRTMLLGDNLDQQAEHQTRQRLAEEEAKLAALEQEEAALR